MKGSNYESSPDAVFCSLMTTVYLPQAPNFFFRGYLFCVPSLSLVYTSQVA